MELGKIELLSRNKKLFGMIICSIFFCQYSFFVLIYHPLTQQIQFEAICYHYGFLSSCILILSMISLVILFPIVKKQRKEIKILNKVKKEQKSAELDEKKLLLLS